MKYSILAAILLIALVSCNNHKKYIVDTAFTDSLVNNFSPSPLIKTNADELVFWGGRIDPKRHDIINEGKYAGLLAARFNLLGDIKDMASSDSVLYALNASFNSQEASVKLSQLHNAITQHRFAEADSLLNQARRIGLRTYEGATASFDVDFELGHYQQAKSELRTIAVKDDYGYQFRSSKLWHYKGNVDSAVYAMKSATKIAESSPALKQSSLSNTADLYLHNSELEKAYDLYVESIRLGSSDMHSIMGIAWIALVHDKKDTLAEKLYQFVHSKTKIADPLYKLQQVAEQRGDKTLQKKYAEEFVAQVNDRAYGNMYNKYTIELYTGILNDPAKAEAVAKNELLSRATPQTYAWYVWALFKNSRTSEAYKVYEEYVSGKPLEGLELYYMGMLMKSMSKGYNAQQFFKAAYKNRYDLSPAKQNELEAELEDK